LRDWKPNDDPWNQHAFWFSGCRYFISKKEEDYVQKVKQNSNKLHKKPIIDLYLKLILQWPKLKSSEMFPLQENKLSLATNLFFFAAFLF